MSILGVSLGGPEVCELGLPVLVQDDVVGLQISVHYALLPEVVEPIYDVGCEESCGLDL